MQTILVTIILTLSVAYAAYRIWRLLKHTNDPCAGCSGCAMKEARRKNMENRCCSEKKCRKNLASWKNSSTFASANLKGRPKLVPWMSGLVNGLQNRLRRFESARHLLIKFWNHNTERVSELFLFTPIPKRTPTKNSCEPTEDIVIPYQFAGVLNLNQLWGQKSLENLTKINFRNLLLLDFWRFLSSFYLYFR